MAKIKNLLLIGNAGKGKSTLANVLTGTNEFEESSNRINGTSKVKAKEFEHEGIKYRVIDTVGIGISTVSTGEILSRLEDKSDILCEGLNQILFVTNCRFTKEEVEAFDLLSNAIFDDRVTDYTTIVCTNFPNFEDKKACDEDLQEFRKEIAKRSISLALTATIYVDNPPMIGHYKLVSGISRRASRKVLLNHLKTCQEVSYQPKLLSKFSKMVEEFNSIIEDTIEAINDFEIQCNNNIDHLGEFIFKRENLVEMIVKRREEVKEYMKDRSKTSTVSHSVILIGKALTISGIWFPPALVPGAVISAVGLLGVSGSESVAIIKENDAYKLFEETLEKDKEKCKKLKESQEELRESIRRFKAIHHRLESSEYRKQNIDKKRIEVIENVMTVILGEEIEADVKLEKKEENQHSTGLKAARATIENICKLVPSPLSFYCIYRDRKEIESRTSLDDMDKAIKNWGEELKVLEEKEQQLNEIYEKIKLCKKKMEKE